MMSHQRAKIGGRKFQGLRLEAWCLKQKRFVAQALSPAGVTLLELMIVVTILGILTAMVTGGYSSMQLQQRLNTNVDKLTTALHFARNWAVANNAQSVFEIDSSSIPATIHVWDYKDFAIVDSDRNLPVPILHPELAPVDAYHFEPGYVPSMPAHIFNLYFYSDGSASSAPIIRIDFNGIPQKQIHVYQGGMIRVEKIL